MPCHPKRPETLSAINVFGRPCLRKQWHQIYRNSGPYRKDKGNYFTLAKHGWRATHKVLLSVDTAGKTWDIHQKQTQGLVHTIH